jgi:hypothetical protein
MVVGCAVHPARIDFNVMPLASSSDANKLVLIEDTPQLHAELARLIEFIDEDVGSYSVCRVGVYLHFLTLAANIEEGNTLLARVIPDKYRARITNEEDFIFQVNRPSASQRVEGVKINYVTKWSTDRFQVLSVPASMGAPVTDFRGIVPQEFIGASVTFDHNNVPVTFPLNSKQQSSLLRECLVASELMQREIGLKVEGF